MSRWKFTIEYKGTDYAGWQRQKSEPSVQQAVEEAIEGFSQRKIKLQVAGRTDAGVHASAQVAHGDLKLKREMTGHEVAKAINAYLRKHTISVIKAEKVADDFHARFGAKNKLYHYRIIQRSAKLALDDNLAWQVKHKLSTEMMHEAAQLLIGKHDFSAFRDSGCQAKSPIKTLKRLDVTQKDYDGVGGIEILIAAESQSFLHHQVRNMVGTLKMVGEGKWSVKQVKKALESKDRAKAGPTAPPDGLYLVRVDY